VANVEKRKRVRKLRLVEEGGYEVASALNAEFII
jgi:hypothetical protein